MAGWGLLVVGARTMVVVSFSFSMFTGGQTALRVAKSRSDTMNYQVVRQVYWQFSANSALLHVVLVQSRQAMARSTHYLRSSRWRHKVCLPHDQQDFHAAVGTVHKMPLAVKYDNCRCGFTNW